jgi:hypothetical protein
MQVTDNSWLRLTHPWRHKALPRTFLMVDVEAHLPISRLWRRQALQREALPYLVTHMAWWRPLIPRSSRASKVVDPLGQSNKLRRGGVGGEIISVGLYLSNNSYGGSTGRGRRDQPKGQEMSNYGRGTPAILNRRRRRQQPKGVPAIRGAPTSSIIMWWTPHSHPLKIP